MWYTDRSDIHAVSRGVLGGDGWLLIEPGHLSAGDYVPSDADDPWDGELCTDGDWNHDGRCQHGGALSSGELVAVCGSTEWAVRLQLVRLEL